MDSITVIQCIKCQVNNRHQRLRIIKLLRRHQDSIRTPLHFITCINNRMSTNKHKINNTVRTINNNSTKVYRNNDPRTPVKKCYKQQHTHTYCRSFLWWFYSFFSYVTLNLSLFFALYLNWCLTFTVLDLLLPNQHIHTDIRSFTSFIWTLCVNKRCWYKMNKNDPTKKKLRKSLDYLHRWRDTALQSKYKMYSHSRCDRLK